MVKYDLPLTFFFLLTKMKNDYPWDVNTHRLILHYFFYLVILFFDLFHYPPLPGSCHLGSNGCDCICTTMSFF